MAWAKEMGGLVRDLRVSHRDRTHFVNDSRKYTHELLADFRGALKDISAANKVMSEDLREFLSKSESLRNADFKTMMEDIHGRITKIRSRVKEVLADGRSMQEDARKFMVRVGKEIEELQGKVKVFLSGSESARKADFKSTMKGISDRIDSIRVEVEAVRKTARETVSGFRIERKEASAHWASLPERETSTEALEKAAEAAETQPATVHKKKKSKKK
jgi:uncharacterized protein YoxC